MKVQITITDDSGKKFTGEMLLIPTHIGSTKHVEPKPTAKSPRIRKSQDIDLTQKIRPFILKHVASETSGAQKFVMVLAWMAKGNTNAQINIDDLEKQWGKVKGPLRGKYYRTFSTRAKDSGWADSPKQGVYTLLDTWQEAFL